MGEATDLHIHVRGRGTPIVLSHGVGSDTTVWEALAADLSADHLVAAWDQPGHGASAALADPTGYGPGVAYASLVRVAEPHGRVVLIGHSLGGYLSARYAIDHPERVVALILIATGPGFRSPEARQKWNRDVERMAEKQGRPEALVGLHEDAHVMDHLADIRCPTLVIVGSEDAAFLGATDYIERKIPDAERVTIADAGHMVPETHGAEIARMVREFLGRRLPG
jgi:pimeloyl-ACP methyl ester carboxylesterase